jgi:hypothetical protein
MKVKYSFNNCIELSQGKMADICDDGDETLGSISRDYWK